MNPIKKYGICDISREYGVYFLCQDGIWARQNKETLLFNTVEEAEEELKKYLSPKDYTQKWYQMPKNLHFYLSILPLYSFNF